MTRSSDAVSPGGQRVFEAKLQVPPPSIGALRRTRLHRALDRAVDAGGVVVSAPPGSGKTELAAAWAREQRERRQVAWLTLDSGDRDPARFLTYALAAIGRTVAGGRALEQLREAAWPQPDEEYLLAASEALSALEQDVVLVLDDFQLVSGSDTERLARRIMRFSPSSIRPIVLSRTEPALGQLRLRLAGRLLELDERDLAFRPDEVAELLETHDVRVDPDDLEALRSSTRGWAAGLVLLATSLPGRAGPESSATGWGRGHARVRDYLRQEVFTPQPPEVRRFLVHAATTNPVCGDLADVLTGQSGGAEALEDLARQHVFLTPVEDARMGDLRWFRWHPMFAGLLRQRMHAEDPALEKSLHRRAAAWLRANGFPVEAVHQALAGEDADLAAAVLGESWLDLVLDQRSDVVRGLLALFDETQRAANAELALACAFTRIQRRELDRATRCCGTALDVADGVPPERRRAVDLMATVVALNAASMTGHVEDADLLPSARRLVRQTSAPDRFLTRAEGRRRALLLYDLGVFESSRWELEEARDHLYAALAEAATLGLPQLAVRCRANLAWIDLLSGRLEDASVAARQVLEQLGTDEEPSRRSLAVAHLALGGVEVLRGHVEAGEAELASAGRLTERIDVVNRCRIAFLMHAALRTAGRISAARSELLRLRSAVQKGVSAPWTGMLLNVAEAHQLGAERRTEGALAALDETRADALGPEAARHWAALRAEALLRLGRPELALSALSRAAVEVPSARPVDVLALVVHGLAVDELGRPGEALEVLTRAVELAAPERVVLPFLTSVRVRPLLETLLDRGTGQEQMVLEILGLLGAPQQPGRAVRRLYVEPLTDREIEVLRLMQGTSSNDELAQRLFVSVNTVRTHMKHINRKLDTSSRREAVTRGRELGLI